MSGGVNRGEGAVAVPAVAVRSAPTPDLIRAQSQNGRHGLGVYGGEALTVGLNEFGPLGDSEPGPTCDDGRGLLGDTLFSEGLI